ncbi:MAG: hypothetical protein K1X53_03910, partial [Candidatus Sumerlaeaceae bacterium]|nr:hypothetical protein [Candidatus Sumerlaeaceae bacterium]
LCEINGDFVAHLERRFDSDPDWKKLRNQVTIHHGPVETLTTAEPFDHIICGLPFNNFPPEVVEHIFQSFEKALKPGGTANFFEYAAIRRLKGPFVGKKEKERLRQIAGILGKIIQKRQKRARLILLNFPPAWTRSLQY